MTAARGLGIDVDEAQYIASLIPADRGQIRTLKECFYGDEDKDFKPIAPFVNKMTVEYPELWEVAQKIEGLICGTGVHAGGVIFVDEPFTNSTALMRAPDGRICTQFDLHDCEDVSLIKYDALSVEAMDKIHICLDLLCNYGYIKRENTLKETYEKVLNVYSIERNNSDMWHMIWEHKILSLFQMEQQSGIQGISLAKPESVNDLCVLNSVIRLMAPDKNSDTPLVTWSKYRKNINLWIKEMRDYGLTNEEIDWLKNHSAITDGICESQEGLMSLVQEPRLGGNSLTFADKCRKGIAKKQGKLFQECEEIFYNNIKLNHCSQTLAHYVWDILLKVQRGYSFNRSHCLAYSLIALQEMNLAFKYPIIFWNCSCLISDTGADEDSEENESANYDKIANAIGKMTQEGVKIEPPNINKSEFNFIPNVENNSIFYGLQPISGTNPEIIAAIKEGRPYKSFKDFMNKNKFGKTVMISLIKSGAFDELEVETAKELNIEPRVLIMVYYLDSICGKKEKLNLQNFNSLIQYNLLPSSLDFVKRVYIYNKALKANKKWKEYYVLNEENYLKFYIDYFSKDKLSIIGGVPCIKMKYWDTIYDSIMDEARVWIKENMDTILEEYNTLLFKENWDKYASGSISSWEMDSICFYYHPHELININNQKYGIRDFYSLKSEEIERFWKRGEKNIPIYKIYKIAGTVISKDDKHTVVNLLTTTGLVKVKFTKEYYAMAAKQISEKQDDGTKKVMEKGWFKRGTKLLINGFRREDTFVAKTYSNTNGHQLYKIIDVDKYGDIELTHERYGDNSKEN